jgi:predicted AAA+ superfamily ATPase
MKRDIEAELLQWKQKTQPMPLLLRGARQVGKTFIIEKFGLEHFQHMVTINFELQPEMIRCFDSLDPVEIINAIYMMTEQKIEPNKSLLFLDEIQDCPNAIRALRYFKEKLPNQHIIAAGSLLEFTLNDSEFRLPVGRIRSMYLKPLSFKEFLSGGGHHSLREWVENVNLESPVAIPVHEKLLKLVREYLVLGGMPAVLQEYFSTRDLRECQYLQSGLLSNYRQDFGKYASKSDHRYLQCLYEKIPGLIGNTFKYSKVDPDMKSRDIKSALQLLQYAGLVYPVYCTSASGVPLSSLINEKKFKVLFLDVGLVTRSGKMDVDIMMNDDVMTVSRGMLAEQFIGQELLAYTSCYEEAAVYYWSREQRSSMAEVDYVTTIQADIIPIEVKSGATGHLRSIKLFIEEKKSKMGVRFSQQPLSFHDGILSLPLYMAGEYARMISSLFSVPIK